jgi:hypothetical protein
LGRSSQCVDVGQGRDYNHLKILQIRVHPWLKHADDFPGQLRSHRRVKSAKQQEKLFDMGKKCFVMTLAVLAFGFGTALRSNAGTDMIEPYRAPAPIYNYAPPPPPRPVLYVPPPLVGVVVAPGFGYYGARYGYYGSRRFYGRPAYWRGHHNHWH